MEAIGVVASIIAVIQLSQAVVTLCYAYQAGVKNAPKDMVRIIDEVKSLQSVLEQLVELIENADDATRSSILNLLCTPDGPINKCMSELEGLREIVAPGSGLKETKRKITWPFKEKEIRRALDTIERQKATVSIVLTTDQM